MKATYILKRNIESLLTARGLKQHDLAVWCRRSDAWISKILSDTSNPRNDRGVPLRDLDRIADFFGLAAYQLFQPGISPLTERRKGADRRSGRDRRVSHLTQQVRGALAPVKTNLQEEDLADLIRLRALSVESRVMLRKQMQDLERSERQTAGRAPRRRSSETAAGEATTRSARAATRRRLAGAQNDGTDG